MTLWRTSLLPCLDLAARRKCSYIDGGKSTSAVLERKVTHSCRKFWYEIGQLRTADSHGVRSGLGARRYSPHATASTVTMFARSYGRCTELGQQGRDTGVHRVLALFGEPQTSRDCLATRQVYHWHVRLSHS